MKSKTPVVGPSPDAQMQQDLEDMRAGLLREIQDGDEMEDERVEAVSQQVARVRPRQHSRLLVSQGDPAAQK